MKHPATPQDRLYGATNIKASVGFWQEHKADTAIAALKANLALKARVLRDGKWRTLSASELVPGDVIELHLGNIVPADVVLAQGQYLSVDQSALTGESLPVDKKVGDVAYSGSVAKMGEMKAVVTSTGMDTYFGKTARLVETAGNVSHFQKAVMDIGNFLILSTLALVSLILMVALFRHDPLIDTVLFALILTVAAIPVALPAVLSVTMAVGAERLARMKAIVSRLVAIEEMAGMTVLCADKTGTLTKNQLAAQPPVPIGGKAADEVLLYAALASRPDSVDDPIDGAIMKAFGDPLKLKEYSVLSFTPFDPVSKRSEAKIKSNGKEFRVTKGAPQVILELAKPNDKLRAEVEIQIDNLAVKGYRTLGVARAAATGKWQLIGLVPLFDPPRDDAAETIDIARSMGLNVRMVTGDQTAIARETAKTLHLGTNIIAANRVFGKNKQADAQELIENGEGFAEVFPEDKYNIVKSLQNTGHIVGMTGDGVNDAPALKQADVGIAVSGATDAARAAADVVLTGAGLSVIIEAAKESRRIFERMTSYSTYRIAETIRVLLFMTMSITIFNFYPVTAVMIVLIAILNDGSIMMIAYDNAPVSPKPVRWDMRRVLSISVVLGIVGVISTFSLFWIAEEYLHLPRDVTQTLIFLKLLVAGHLTIYVTRNTGWFLGSPLPNWKLFVTTEAAQILGTLAAVYGVSMSPIGWKYAGLVWGYALLWFFIADIVKVFVFKLMNLHQSRVPARAAKIKATAIT